MSHIFISYRRDDSRLMCDRIVEYLGAIYGLPQIFRDIETIPGGVDFRAAIETGLRDCKIILVVIGPQWATIRQANGYPRLADPRDFVRLEIEYAIQHRIPILPLLVQGAQMPPPQMVPGSLQPVIYQNYRVVRPNPDFHRDMHIVLQDITRYVPKPDGANALRIWRNRAQRTIASVITLISLVAALFALSSWVHIPLLSDFVNHLLGR